METVHPAAQNMGRKMSCLVPEHEAMEAVKTLIRYIGEEPSRDGLKDTPSRVLRSLTEMTRGYKLDAKKLLETTFQESYDQVIVLRGVAFSSLCEHHLLPFTGHVDLGYLPGKVVGLSKLARLVDCYARRLQIQERMTRQIAGDIEQYLEARGVAVVVKASHSCMECRGINKRGCVMITSSMLGVFRSSPEARSEFLSL